MALHLDDKAMKNDSAMSMFGPASFPVSLSSAGDTELHCMPFSASIMLFVLLLLLSCCVVILLYRHSHVIPSVVIGLSWGLRDHTPLHHAL